MARPELVFEFVARYQLDVLERLAREVKEPIFVFPDATSPLRPGMEPPAGTTVRIVPPSGAAWLGVFPPGELKRTRASYPGPVVIGWPDETSFCVYDGGPPSLVDSSDPRKNDVLGPYVVTSSRVVASHGLVLFTDWSDLYAYGREGLVWREHLQPDDLMIKAVEGRTVTVHGMFGDMLVDLETWRVRYPPRS